MIKPLGFRVLIEPITIKEVTDGGIYIPEQSRKNDLRTTTIGTIVSIGPTAWSAYDDGNPWAKVGDKVLYTKYGGKLVVDPSDDKQYVVINDEDCICKVED